MPFTTKRQLRRQLDDAIAKNRRLNDELDTSKFLDTFDATFSQQRPTEQETVTMVLEALGLYEAFETEWWEHHPYHEVQKHGISPDTIAQLKRAAEIRRQQKADEKRREEDATTLARIDAIVKATRSAPRKPTAE